MNRIIAIGLSVFFGSVALALVSGESLVQAGHKCGGCGGYSACDGGGYVDCGGCYGDCGGRKAKKHRKHKGGCYGDYGCSGAYTSESYSHDHGCSGDYTAPVHSEPSYTAPVHSEPSYGCAGYAPEYSAPEYSAPADCPNCHVGY